MVTKKKKKEKKKKPDTIAHNNKVRIESSMAELWVAHIECSTAVKKTKLMS